MDALEHQDHRAAEAVIAGDDGIDRACAAIEGLSTHVITLQQPAVRDLRTVLAAWAVAEDLERIGDYAEGIAQLVLRLPHPPDGAVLGELASLANKLDHKSGGQYDVVTFDPLWGGDLTSWPWTNRADFQNKKQYPTLNTSRMIQSADWMKGWNDRYGQANLNAIALQQTGGKDQFGLGHAATIVDIPSRQSQMNFYGVSFTTKKGDKPFPYWGVGLVPHNAGGKSYSFSGGFSLSMPHNGHRSKGTTDAAWEFIKFMAFVGQRTWAQLTFAIPTVPSIAKNDPILSAQPHWNVFMKAMALGHAGDRNFYDLLFPGDVVLTAQNDILNGKSSAKDALNAAQSQALTNMKRNGGP